MYQERRGQNPNRSLERTILNEIWDSNCKSQEIEATPWPTAAQTVQKVGFFFIQADNPYL